MSRLAASVLLLALVACDAKGAGAPGSGAPSKAPDAAASGATDWATYHGGFSLDGLSDSTVPDAPEKLWKFNAGNRVDHPPVSTGGRIYFTTAKGGLFALDLKGQEVWKTSIAPDIFTSPPLISDGLLILGTGKGVLRALAAADGKEKWAYEVGSSVQGSPNRVDLPGGKKGLVVISQSDGALHGIELLTGKGLWVMPATQRCDGSAGVGAGLIVMGSCASALHVYSVEKSSKVTDVPLGEDNQVAGGVAMSGSHAFAGTRSGKLCAVDVAAGKILWKNADGQGEAFMTPAVSDKVVVFGADDGKIYALNRATGARLWDFDTKNRPTSPVIARDRVVVSSGGTLFVFDLAGGKKLWSAPVSDELTSPAVVGGLILVGGDDGTVTAFGRK